MTEVLIDDHGLTVPRGLDEPLNVEFDGERVWSFNPARDGEPAGAARRVPWPRALSERLAGAAEVRLVPHNGEEVLFDGRIVFGGVEEPLNLRDSDGHPLTIDKSGRLQRTFAHIDDSSRRHLVEATKRVLDDLRDACGMDAYLVYGCLLGARRDGKMIGHDSDTDVAFLSKHTHPFDIVRECRRAEQTMRERGWKIARMSGASFKVWVSLPNGARAGVDVFGSFHIGGYFHITGSLRGVLPREAIMPFSTITLEGVEMPAPADVDAFLAFTYGPTWRVPDPAFHFDHPPQNRQIMTDWWRSYRRGARRWHTFYQSAAGQQVPTTPSLFAQWAHERVRAFDADRGAETGASNVVDLGCGNGRDAVFFAQQGHGVHALDYAPRARALTQRLARSNDVQVHVGEFSVASLRDMLIRGAQLRRLDGPVHVYARGFLDALPPDARTYLWRFTRLVQGTQGLTFLEFRTPRSRKEPKHFGAHPRYFVAPGELQREIEAHGGAVVEMTTGRDLAPLGDENPHICRMIVRWNP